MILMYSDGINESEDQKLTEYLENQTLETFDDRLLEEIILGDKTHDFSMVGVIL